MCLRDRQRQTKERFRSRGFSFAGGRAMGVVPMLRSRESAGCGVVVGCVHPPNLRGTIACRVSEGGLDAERRYS